MNEGWVWCAKISRRKINGHWLFVFGEGHFESWVVCLLVKIPLASLVSLGEDSWLRVPTTHKHNDNHSSRLNELFPPSINTSCGVNNSPKRERCVCLTVCCFVGPWHSWMLWFLSMARRTSPVVGCDLCLCYFSCRASVLLPLYS